MSDEAKFDPRFDPAFQRGYDGPTRVAPQPRPQSTPLISAPPAVSRSVPGESSAGQQRILVEPTVFGDEDEQVAARRPNPFLIALLAIAVLLIAGGSYVATSLSDLFSSTNLEQYDYITLQVMTIAAPLVIVLGVATGIGVLFIYAVRWNRA